MKLTVLDLEHNQPSGKIVQIGAVVGDSRTGEITHRLRIYVNPEEPIAPYITDLCGITQDQIDSQGVSLTTAYQELKSFHRKYSTFINPVTWGGGDSQYIFDRLPQSEKDDWCFGRRWIDAKTIYVTERIAKGEPVQGGLARVMTKYNLKFQGRKHDAQDDAENTWKLYYEMLVRSRNK